VPASGKDLLTATEKLLAPLTARVAGGRLTGAAAIGVEVGKVISKYKGGNRYQATITDDSLAITRKQDQIDAKAASWTELRVAHPRPHQPAGRPRRGDRL
jgi:hypothetical protein